MKALKVHNEKMATDFNKVQKLDRDYEDVSGVSPIRYRHKVNLYGLESGIGQFCPIMVENLTRMPEPEEYEDPAILAKNKDKSPLKETKKTNEPKEKSKSPAPAAPAKDKKDEKKKKPAKLVVTNQNKKKAADFSQFNVPGTF